MKRELWLLAGDLGSHYGLAIGNTTTGYVASANEDLTGVRRGYGYGRQATLVYEGAAGLIEKHAPGKQIHYVAYEEPFSVRGGARNALYACWMGLLMAADDYGATFTEALGYNGSRLKSRVAGYGLASKEQMVEAVGDWTGLDFADDNEADAVAVLKCGLEDLLVREAARSARGKQGATSG